MVSHKSMHSNRLLPVLFSIVYSSALFSSALTTQNEPIGYIAVAKNWWGERSFKEKCMYGGVGLATVIGVGGCGYALWKHRNSSVTNKKTVVDLLAETFEENRRLHPARKGGSASSSGSKSAASVNRTTESDFVLIKALVAFNSVSATNAGVHGLIDLLQESIDTKNNNGVFKSADKNMLMEQFVCVNNALERLPEQEKNAATELLFSMWSTYGFALKDWILLKNRLSPESRFYARILEILNDKPEYKFAEELETWKSADFVDGNKIWGALQRFSMTASQAFAFFMTAGSFERADKNHREELLCMLFGQEIDLFFVSEAADINNLMLCVREFDFNVSQIPVWTMLANAKESGQNVKASLIATLRSLLPSASDLDTAGRRTIDLIASLPSNILTREEKQELFKEIIAEVDKNSLLGLSLRSYCFEDWQLSRV